MIDTTYFLNAVLSSRDRVRATNELAKLGEKLYLSFAPCSMEAPEMKLEYRIGT